MDIAIAYNCPKAILVEEHQERKTHNSPYRTPRLTDNLHSTLRSARFRTRHLPSVQPVDVPRRRYPLYEVGHEARELYCAHVSFVFSSRKNAD